MRNQRLAEGLALSRVGERRLERGARHADRLCGDVDATRLQVGERDAIADALLGESVIQRDVTVLEHDLRRVGGVLAGLFLDARDDPARGRGRHDEGADALLARVAVGDREDDRDIGGLARGDELLYAVQHVARRPSAWRGS